MRKLVSCFIIAIAAITLGACGGSDNKTTTPATDVGNTPTGGNAGAGGDSGKFCQQLISADATDITDDPNGAKEALNIFRELDPPAQVSGQWGDYLNFLDELSKVGEDDDAAKGAVVQRHIQSISAVGLFVTQSCASALASGSIPSAN